METNHRLAQSQIPINNFFNNYPFLDPNLNYLLLTLQDNSNPNLLNIQNFPYHPIGY